MKSKILVVKDMLLLVHQHGVRYILEPDIDVDEGLSVILFFNFILMCLLIFLRCPQEVLIPLLIIAFVISTVMAIRFFRIFVKDLENFWSKLRYVFFTPIPYVLGSFLNFFVYDYAVSVVSRKFGYHSIEYLESVVNLTSNILIASIYVLTLNVVLFTYIGFRAISVIRLPLHKQISVFVGGFASFLFAVIFYSLFLDRVNEYGDKIVIWSKFSKVYCKNLTGLKHTAPKDGKSLVLESKTKDGHTSSVRDCY